MKVNGRVIKNVVKIAGLVAESEGGDLRMEHIETVLELRGLEITAKIVPGKGLRL